MKQKVLLLVLLMVGPLGLIRSEAEDISVDMMVESVLESVKQMKDSTQESVEESLKALVKNNQAHHLIPSPSKKLGPVVTRCVFVALVVLHREVEKTLKTSDS